MTIKLHCLSTSTDNYIWALNTTDHQVIIIDPGEAKPVIQFLSRHSYTAISILLTHHHNDHTAGVIELQHTYPDIAIFAPDEVDLPVPINYVNASQSIAIADINFGIIHTPGHTLGHIAYYSRPYLFCGDTLFSAGCGRVFEGTFSQMYQSMNKLKNLPDQTIVCPAHEYTLNNLKFAKHMLPNDAKIQAYWQKMQHQQNTLPTTIKTEKEINLFLRCDEQHIQEKFNKFNEEELFIFFRTQKDNF